MPAHIHMWMSGTQAIGDTLCDFIILSILENREGIGTLMKLGVALGLEELGVALGLVKLGLRSRESGCGLETSEAGYGRPWPMLWGSGKLGVASLEKLGVVLGLREAGHTIRTRLQMPLT